MVCAALVSQAQTEWFVLSLGHDMLQAVKQQQQRFSDLREQFARRLASHLNSVFVQQVLLTAF